MKRLLLLIALIALLSPANAVELPEYKATIWTWVVDSWFDLPTTQTYDIKPGTPTVLAQYSVDVGFLDADEPPQNKLVIHLLGKVFEVRAKRPALVEAKKFDFEFWYDGKLCKRVRNVRLKTWENTTISALDDCGISIEADYETWAGYAIEWEVAHGGVDVHIASFTISRKKLLEMASELNKQVAQNASAVLAQEINQSVEAFDPLLEVQDLRDFTPINVGSPSDEVYGTWYLNMQTQMLNNDTPGTSYRIITLGGYATYLIWLGDDAETLTVFKFEEPQSTAEMQNKLGSFGEFEEYLSGLMDDGKLRPLSGKPYHAKWLGFMQATGGWVFSNTVLYDYEGKTPNLLIDYDKEIFSAYDTKVNYIWINEALVTGAKRQPVPIQIQDFQVPIEFRGTGALKDTKEITAIFDSLMQLKVFKCTAVTTCDLEGELSPGENFWLYPAGQFSLGGKAVENIIAIITFPSEEGTYLTKFAPMPEGFESLPDRKFKVKEDGSIYELELSEFAADAGSNTLFFAEKVDRIVVDVVRKGKTIVEQPKGEAIHPKSSVATGACSASRCPTTATFTVNNQPIDPNRTYRPDELKTAKAVINNPCKIKSSSFELWRSAGGKVSQLSFSAGRESQTASRTLAVSDGRIKLTPIKMGYLTTYDSFEALKARLTKGAYFFRAEVKPGGCDIWIDSKDVIIIIGEVDKTCAELGGVPCTEGECKGALVKATDTDKCCIGDCILPKTCAEKGGKICDEGFTCEDEGKLVVASDTDGKKTCCLGKCVDKSCKQLGGQICPDDEPCSVMPLVKAKDTDKCCMGDCIKDCGLLCWLSMIDKSLVAGVFQTE